MEAFPERRRNANTGSALIRSRSVRASLRMIGNRWKNQKQSDMMRLNQSLSDPEESKTQEIYTQIIKSDELYSGYHHWRSGYKDSEDPIDSEMEVKEINCNKQSKKAAEKRDVTLILRSSSDRLNKLEKKEKFTDLFTRSSSTKHKENGCKDEDIFRIPSSVPPKAAAILHIPAAKSLADQSDSRFLVNGFSSDCGSELTGMGPPLGTNQECSEDDTDQKRSRRGSEGDQGSSPRQIFTFYSPPKDRKHGLWMSESQLSKYKNKHQVDRIVASCSRGFTFQHKHSFTGWFHS